VRTFVVGGFLRASTGLADDRTFARSVGNTVALILDTDGPDSASVTRQQSSASLNIMRKTRKSLVV
jgi:hypothetical protein